MKLPLVSIVITTKNEQLVLERLLISIKKQTYPKIETIIVDNHSIDQTRSIAQRYTKSVFIKGPERSSQRNFGAKKSTGEYLLFLDADMELSKSVVKQAVNILETKKNLAMVIIPEKSIAEKYWEKVKAYERSFYALEGDSQIEAARFFSRTIFNLAKGYDPKITGPEDWDLPERINALGYQSGRIKSLINHYERVSSPLDLAKKKFYYGLKSSIYLTKNNISVISPKTIYFLRPVFYKNWRKLIANPTLTISMLFMLILEQFGGALGYLTGKFKAK